MPNIEDLDQTAQHMRVSWRKAHNYFSTFATVFFAMKKEFDAGEYPGWTFDMWAGQKAGISPDQAMKKLKIFVSTIAADEREKILAETARMERDHRAQKLARMAERNADLVAQQKLRAEAKAVKEADMALREKEKAERDRIKAKALTKKRREAHQELKKNSVPPQVTPAIDELNGVADQIRSWKEKAEQTRIDWIDATMHIAELMVKAREHFPSDTLFGKWLVEQNVNYNIHDRAALIHFGYEPEIARKVLEETDRRSYKWIWEVEMKSKSKIATIG